MFYNKKTIGIEGMHCEHCASNVEESLRKIEWVKSVKVSFENKNAILRYKGDFDFDLISKIIEELGYYVIEEKNHG